MSGNASWRVKLREPRRFVGPKGSLEVGHLAPGVIFQHAEGHATGAIARDLCARLDELVARFGKVEIFDDWYGITSYDHEARRSIEHWTKVNRPSFDRIHVLLSSKLVAMAIAVSNLVTQGATVTYTDRAAFDRALTEALSRR